MRVLSRRIRPITGNMGMGTLAQATLELTLAIAGILIFLWASIKIFIWVNQTLVLRQEKYETSRAATWPYMEDESEFPALNIFGNEE